MYIRTTIGKFPTKLKCDMFLSYSKSEIIPKLRNNSKLISLRTIIRSITPEKFAQAFYEANQ